LIRKAGIYVWHAAVCLVVVIAILVIFWVVFYTRSVYHRRDAERLLRDLQDLPSGAAGVSRAAEIANKFGATKHCTAGQCRYHIQISFGWSKWGSMLPLRRTEWDSLGVRPWRVDAGIEIRNNQVTDTGFEAVIARGRGWLYNEGPLAGNDWGWWGIFLTTGSDQFGRLFTSEKESARANAVATGHQIEVGTNGIIIRKPSFDIQGGGEALNISLSPSAPPNSRAVAFDVNLRCATAMSSCTELCQLAPSAWQAYSQYQKSNGWYVEELQHCPAARRPY
jgi:hypothetical protein